AAAATALACGVKTYNAAIGMQGTTPEQAVRAENILEVAEKAGKSTGVVTSVEFSHATPAGFVAHNARRDAYQAIAEEMVNASAADVIMGCGHPHYDNDGRQLEKPKYQFIGEATWGMITAGTAGAAVDADRNGKPDDAWTVLQDRVAFQALATAANPPKRVLGIPQVLTTLQQARAGAKKDDLPYAVPPTERVPTLAEMTAGALNVLGRNPRGFVVMIEGGAIDWAGHANQSGRLIEEMVAFNRAVETAVSWVAQHGSWRETLLIVTADHETGYLTGPQADPANPAWSMVTNAGQGTLPGMAWNSGGHTNSLVPFFAMGQGSAALQARAVRRDPVRGLFLDNTDLFHVLRPALR
ncbi:MAG TPA: alkaline phosphatase, partial [Armatimonadota bacterium]|nr:alkaline phosphatase [Armatimonadota bacterium]